MSSLTAEGRTALGSRASRRLRSEGKIPAVLYGHHEAVRTLSLDEMQFAEFLRRGSTGLLDLSVDGETESVVIKEIQYDTFGREVLHVDFTRVSVGERIIVDVPVVLKGAAPGVTDGGILEHALRSIELECSAGSAPDEVVVPITELQIEQQITIGDLDLPANAKPVDDAERIVVQVLPAPDESEEEEATGPIEPELIRKEKAEEEADGA